MVPDITRGREGRKTGINRPDQPANRRCEPYGPAEEGIAKESPALLRGAQP